MIETLDRALQGTDTKLHLFGLKGIGASELRDHPRVATVDSQAYGTQARVLAREAQISKSNQFLAGIMSDWYRKQVEGIQRPPSAANHPPALLDLAPRPPSDPFEARLDRAREEMRKLLEDGEIDWTQIHDLAVLAYAFDGQEEEEAQASIALPLAA